LKRLGDQSSAFKINNVGAVELNRMRIFAAESINHITSTALKSQQLEDSQKKDQD
jgi:hypothetical protein